MIHQGDALSVLKTLPDESVNCCVTSPPYWGLRDYGVDGQLGLEKTPEEYVAKMVEIFREVRRVLRSDGTLWLNIGDSYCSNTKWGGESGNKNSTSSAGGYPRGKKSDGLKPKDMVMIPARVALALQADGWWLRSDIIWAKSNPMPESVTDRPTKSHEYIFLMAKSQRYHYDAEAIKEPGVTHEDRPHGVVRDRIFEYDSKQAVISGRKKPAGWDTDPGSHGSFHREGRAKPDKQRGHSRRHDGFNDLWDAMEKAEQCSGKRNKRDVWTVATQPYPEAHFATFPEKLIEPCILAGCPERGIVLDPFLGSGTTAAVALRLNRQFVGIELNPEYIKLAEKRMAQQRLAI